VLQTAGCDVVSTELVKLASANPTATFLPSEHRYCWAS
jgi:hypothetical protein